MKYNLKKVDEKSFLNSKNNTAVEANKEFVNISDYCENELIKKQLGLIDIICSVTQLLEACLKNDSFEANKDNINKNLNAVKQNCYSLTKLINNIVDLSKIESGFFKLNLSNENIVQITEDIVQSVSEYIKRMGISIVFDTNTEKKIIACDSEKIESVILNLISNAVKFSNSGDNIFICMLDKGDTVEIEIKDTGIGIENKYLSYIFKEFQQVDKSLYLNAEESGIGLYLVKSVVEMHGGKINVESEVRKGSIFKVELPVRIVENPKVFEQTRPLNNKIQKINIEFSDIYSI